MLLLNMTSIGDSGGGHRTQLTVGPEVVLSEPGSGSGAFIEDSKVIEIIRVLRRLALSLKIHIENGISRGRRQSV